MSKLDEFKAYLKLHPGLQNEVINRKLSWQEVYETWTLADDDPFKEYGIKDKIKKEDKVVKEEVKEESTEDMVKTLLGYAKKINPDNVTKYVTSIQKILELLSSFGAGATAASIKKNSADPLFDRKFDDWY